MKPTLKIVGEDGNIFNLLAIARKKYRQLTREEPDTDWEEKWQLFLDEVQSSKSYDEALVVFMEYFEVE
jgi:predicted AAA+ superfamily ATPase